MTEKHIYGLYSCDRFGACQGYPVVPPIDGERCRARQSFLHSPLKSKAWCLSVLHLGRSRGVHWTSTYQLFWSPGVITRFWSSVNPDGIHSVKAKRNQPFGTIWEWFTLPISGKLGNGVLMLCPHHHPMYVYSIVILGICKFIWYKDSDGIYVPSKGLW